MVETIPPGGTYVADAGRRPGVGYACLVAAAVLFAINGTVSKVILDTGVSSLRLTELRCAGALAGLAVLLLLIAPERLRVSRRELPLLAAFGIAGVAATQWFYFVAIARMPVGIALLLEYTAPVLVALWARFVMHEHVRNRMWVALALALAGLALVAQVWNGGTLDGLGVAAAFAAAIALATYYLLGEHSTTSRDPLSTTFWSFVFATALWTLLLPWWSFPGSAFTGSTSLLGNAADVSVPMWALAAWMIVLGTIVPFALVLTGLRHLPATRVGTVGMLEPVIASAVAWVWLGEVLGTVQLAGGLVVLTGILLAQTAR
ncbi:MAG: EamA family transporter [Sporichthyaceae bacterium]